ncbi:TIGR00159 family protein, partial [Bacteroidales bacterium OttesenSCG-928-L03]|nr:TIGR00159 family protein [Bacteroidales bacterium OttesenSCG-928-L03]
MLFHFGIKDAIDVLLVAFLLYEVWLLMKKTNTTAIFLGVLSFFIIWLLVSQVFEMRLTGAILDKIVDVGILILIIVFQKEIREFLQNLGTNKWIRSLVNIFKPKGRNVGVDEDISTIMPIVLAVMDMSKRNEGALIA